MVGADGPSSTGDLTLRAFAGIVGFFALVQVFCLGTACLGLKLSRGGAAAALFLSLVLALLFGARLRAPSPDRPVARVEPGSDGQILLVRAAAVLAVAWATSVWARLWMLAYHRPPYDWDGLYYHLPAVHEWVQSGRVGWLETHPDVPFVNFPMAVEAFGFVIHQLAPSSRLINAWNLWYWPLAFLAVVVLAGHLGARGVWRWLAGALLAGAPVLVCQSVTCYVDPGFAACVMAAVTSSALVATHGHRISWSMALLWGGSVGLTLGAKGTGLPFAFLFLVVVPATCFWLPGRSQWREWVPKLAVAALTVVAVGGYWSIRNVYHTGNPIHPQELRLGGKTLVPGYDFRSLEENAPEFLRDRPRWMWPAVSWLQLDSPIQGYAPVGGLGYVWLLAGLPAVFVVVGRAWRRAWSRLSLRQDKELFLVALLILLLFIIQPAAWWSRFTVWLHVLGLSCLTLALRRAFESGNRLRRSVVVGLAIAWVGTAILESERTLAIESQTGRTAPTTEDPARFRSTLDMMFPDLATATGFDRLLAAEKLARSRWSRDGTLLGGALALPLGRREIDLLPREPGEADLVRLHRAGVRWVLWDVVGAGEVPALLRRHALEEHIYAPSEGRDFRALLLTPDAAPQASAPPTGGPKRRAAG